MKFSFVSVVFISLILVTFSQKEDKAKEGRGWMNTMTDVMANLQTKVLPSVNEKTSKLVKIIDSHKAPIKDNLFNIKQKLSEHVMSAGFDIMERSLDLADTLQNMTNKIKSEVLELKPRKVVKEK